MRFIPGLVVVLAFPASPVLAKTVPVTWEQQRNLGIDTAPVQTVTEHPVAAIPATVGPARDSRFVLVVPFSGTVTDISALEGQYVTRGTRLGTIFSRDLQDAAQRDADLAEAAFSRANAASRQYYDAQRAELALRATAQRATLQLQIDGHELWVLHDENE